MRCRVPQSVAYRGWCPHRQADRPLPHLAAAAPALTLATRKTTRLSRQSPLLFAGNAPLFVPSHTRVTRHAPSHRALSEFAIPAFTLHLHTYPSDTQPLARELHPHFLLHRGEGKGGEAFTLITLLSNDLRTTGEEVKAKNEKRRTRPRARKTPKSSCIALRFWEYAIGDALREPPGRKISQTPSLLTTCAPPHTSGHFNTISCSTLLMDCSIV